MLDKRRLRELSRNLEQNPDNYMNSLRNNLLMYIGQKDITLCDLANKADVSVNTLKTLVYGYSDDCHLSTVVKLARALNISVDELIGSGTLAPQTCETLQIIRMLPESFTHFVRWATHYHYDMLNSNKVSVKSVELMTPKITEHGNLKVSSNFDVIDISDVNPNVRAKIFMGIKIPNSHYAPTYFENDVVFIANDRDARPGENVVVSISDCMWILEKRMEAVGGQLKVSYYSIRDNRLFAKEEEIQLVVGYIAEVKHLPQE